MSTKICASAFQVEVATSSVQIIYAVVQFLLLTSTFIGSLFAIKSLVYRSIIPDSTRILLLGCLFFANVHEIGYIHQSIVVIQRNFFHKEPSCYPLPTGEDCSTNLTILSMGISGNMCIQCALSLDRLLATLFPFYYPRLRSVPGIILFCFVLLISIFTFKILRQDDVFDDFQLYCVMWPPKMAARANIFLEISVCLILVNVFINIVVIRKNMCQEMRYRFNVQQRYQTSETLKATIAICRLSISQFATIFLYSGGVLLMRKNQDKIPPFYYLNTIIWLYAHPYGCVSLPLLIIFSIRKLKTQRTAKIESIRHQKETHEEHIAKLRQTWS